MMMQFKMAHASVRPKEINAQGKGEHCQFQARHLDQLLSYPQLKKKKLHLDGHYGPVHLKNGGWSKLVSSTDST